jgi:hypothetical protein
MLGSSGGSGSHSDEVDGNDERRLCGLDGDDDDDMREDREELFGRSSAYPIDVDDHAPRAGAGGVAVAGAGCWEVPEKFGILP